MAALGFFGAGIAFFMMLFSGSVQGIFFFLAAVVLFFVLPSLTLFFFYRAKHSRKGLLIGTLLLLLTITVPAFIRLTIESQNEFSEAIVTASTVVIFGWLGALSLTLITWFKIGSTRKPSF